MAQRQERTAPTQRNAHPTKATKRRRAAARKKARRPAAPQWPKKLFQPGWAGELNDSELEVIEKRLGRSKRLAEKWGFAPTQKVLSIDAIKRVALYGDSSQNEANAKLIKSRARIAHNLAAIS